MSIIVVKREEEPKPGTWGYLGIASEVAVGAFFGRPGARGEEIREIAADELDSAAAHLLAHGEGGTEDRGAVRVKPTDIRPDFKAKSESLRLFAGRVAKPGTHELLEASVFSLGEELSHGQLHAGGAGDMVKPTAD